VRRLVDRHAEIRLEPGVPGLGQVVHREKPLDQRAFEVEAHQDVQVVMHLVRLGPDEARVHAVDGGVEGVGIRDPEVAEGRASGCRGSR
jgi:hypothetical protein